MKEDDFARLKATRCCFLGLGLMGGSLAQALRPHCAALHAADPDPAARSLAQQNGLTDTITADPAAMLPRCDLLILAAPVRANIAFLRRLPEMHPGPLMVLDLSSTKREIVAAMSALPPAFDPLGGHPMTGKETSGLAHADPAMFRGAPFALTPLERTSPRLRALALEILAAIDARPLWLDAETHDRWVAATSHLPYLLAAALALATPDEAAPLIGPGFRSTVRLAGSHPAMMLDILATNRTPVLQALARYRAALDDLETALRGDEAALHARLTTAHTRREHLLA